ncbi:MAG: hypothetical protein NTU60_11250 [Candidatus Aminicenantes bacterium]|nr:hypothetical protein [Candidatus Aminicenantes bacterium]
MRKGTRSAILAVGLLGVLCSAGRSEGGLPPLALEVIPASLQLACGDEADILALTRNTSDESLQGLHLTFFTNADVRVVISPSEARALAPGGGLTWNVHISRTGPGTPGSQVYLRLDYESRAGSGAPAVPGIAIGALDILDLQSEQAEKVARVKIESATDLLEENRPCEILFIVQNISGFPVAIEAITGWASPSIAIKGPLLENKVRLSPGESRIFPAEAVAGDAVRTGEHVLYFETKLAWERAGQLRSGRLVTTHRLKAGVLGESDLLKVLGVPSFLLLPGFLVVTTFLALWSGVKPKKATQLDAKSARFWLFAITLSLFAAPLYPVITDLFGRARNYLIAYGLRDIFWVWTGSLLAGVLGWLICIGVMEGADRRKRRQRARSVPSEDDAPLEILEKLRRLGLGLCLQQADVHLEGLPEQRYFLVGSVPEGGKDLWIIPAILLKWTDSALQDDRVEFTRLVDAGDIRGLGYFIQERTGTENRIGTITLRWDPPGGARKADLGRIKVRENLPSSNIIREEE